VSPWPVCGEPDFLSLAVQNLKKLARFRASSPPAPSGLNARIREPRRLLYVIVRCIPLLVGAEVHPADVQDRDGAVLIIEAIHQLFPWLRHLFADSAYNGPNLREALAKFGDWTLQIVKRAADAAGFQLLPRRWVVEPNPRLAQSQPPPGKGFRGFDRERQSVGLHCLRVATH
jgi:Transposase DDE domain